MADKNKPSRDAAKEFGENVEDAAASLGKSLDALRGKAPIKPTSDGDEPTDGGGIVININR
jgi:hypothetical protein